MSKVLKFIVHFVVICTILCVVGLAVPPFFGVTTVIMDDSSKETNLPIGSVTYAIPVKSEKIEIGDPILVQENSKVYRYKISTKDLESGICTVTDPTVSNPETITVAIKSYVPKVVITIGYLGYLLVATESIEGLIVLGLAVLFLIILYVIAELWKKEPQEAYEEEDPEPGYVKSPRELKREDKERARLMKEEDRQFRKEEKMRRKEEKRIIRTGGFVDEIYEDDLTVDEKAHPVTVQTATSEAHELLKKEIAAATAEEPAAESEAPRIVKPETPVQPAEKTQEEVPAASEEEEEPAVIGKLAIPAWSAAQLADKAKQEGDAPDIVKDDITKVTLFDYSDIIGGTGPAEE